MPPVMYPSALGKVAAHHVDGRSGGENTGDASGQAEEEQPSGEHVVLAAPTTTTGEEGLREHAGAGEGDWSRPHRFEMICVRPREDDVDTSTMSSCSSSGNSSTTSRVAVSIDSEGKEVVVKGEEDEDPASLLRTQRPSQDNHKQQFSSTFSHKNNRNNQQQSHKTSSNVRKTSKRGEERGTSTSAPKNVLGRPIIRAHVRHSEQLMQRAKEDNYIPEKLRRSGAGGGGGIF